MADEVRLVGVFGQDDLEGDRAVYTGLVRAVDDPICALADGFEDFIAFNRWFISCDQMPLLSGDFRQLVIINRD